MDIFKIDGNYFITYLIIFRKKQPRERGDLVDEGGGWGDDSRGCPAHQTLLLSILHEKKVQDFFQKCRNEQTKQQRHCPAEARLHQIKKGKLIQLLVAGLQPCGILLYVRGSGSSSAIFVLKNMLASVSRLPEPKYTYLYFNYRLFLFTKTNE